MQMPGRCLWILILLVFNTNHLSARAEVDTAYVTLHTAAALCLDTGDTPCTEAFDPCITHLLKLADDSLIAEQLIELGTLRMRNNRWDAQTKHLFDLALVHAERSGSPCVEMRSRFALAGHARFLNVSDSLLRHAELSLNSALACGDSTRQARAEVYLGSGYLNQSDYPLALKHFQRAEELYEALEDQSGLGGLYLDMALLYSEMHQKEVARSYTYRASQIFKATGEEMKYGVALVDLSSDLLDVKLVDSALHYLQIAEPIVKRTNLRAAAYLEQNFGAAYYLKGLYREAINHYHEGLILTDKTGNRHLATLLHIWISESYLAVPDSAMAFRHALFADSLSALNPTSFLRAKAMHALAEAAHSCGQHDLSYRSFRRYIVLTDSLSGEEKQREIAALEQVYEAEKSRKAIEFQKQENALLAAAHEASRNRNMALAVCLLLTIGFAYAFISKQRHKIRGQKSSVRIKQLENEKLNREIEFKSRELTTKALYIARKNELIQSLHDRLKLISKDRDSKALNEVVSHLKFARQQEGHWEAFTKQFSSLNPGFYKSFNEKYSDLTKSEMRLAALLRMGLGSKDIAGMLNISEPGVKKSRYRLRQKMNLQSDENLESEIMKF